MAKGKKNTSKSQVHAKQTCAHLDIDDSDSKLEDLHLNIYIIIANDFDCEIMITLTQYFD